MDYIQMEHVGGVPWWAAPVPRRWHRCRAQTRGWRYFDEVERCACGAIRRNGRSWLERNARRSRSVPETDTRAHVTHARPVCHTHLMTDDASRLTDINVHPTYQASLRLACGATVRVTVLDGEILTNIRDDRQELVSAQMTGNEAFEFSVMLRSADCLSRKPLAAARNC
jgi:hypothetical protein